MVAPDVGDHLGENLSILSRSALSAVRSPIAYVRAGAMGDVLQHPGQFVRLALDRGGGRGGGVCSLRPESAAMSSRIPSDLLATVGMTGTPSSRSSERTSIRVPDRSAISTMFSAMTVGIRWSMIWLTR